MRRNDKKAGSKGILLGILFIVTMVVTFLSMISSDRLTVSLSS